jgi:hypothetical protein
MRYRVSGDKVIRSENAAKTHHQKSKELVRLIEALPHVARSLDFGCGKLRYLSNLIETTDHLYVTDSDVQLGRDQRLFGVNTSIRQLARGSNAWAILPLNELYSGILTFDRIFCLNVLQVIPSPRLRQKILNRLSDLLELGGEIVLVVQYRNSDFSRMRKMPSASAFEDGMLLTFSRGVSFYGFIKPAVLKEMVAKAGLAITHAHVHDGSCYIIGTRVS